jgi:hypothetical protein
VSAARLGALVLTTVVLLVSTAGAGSGAGALARSVSASTATAGVVVVEKIGWAQVFQGPGFSVYSWGVVVTNRSTTLDAVGVTVSVSLYAGKHLGEVDGHDYTIPVIPAGRRFYIGDHAASARNPIRITRISVTAEVRAMKPKRSVLPPVSSIRIDKANHEVTAEMTNPYSTAINLDNATGYAVFFDRSGRVIGGAKTAPLADPAAGSTKLKPGAHLRVRFLSLAGVPIARMARAGVSVDPG